MSSTPAPFVSTDKNAPAYWMMDILWVIKVKAAQTDGKFSLIEQTMPHGSGAPPHYHPSMQEMFYLMEGELTISVAGAISVLKPGDFAFVPIGATHYFNVTSKEACKALNMYTPGGFEQSVIDGASPAKSLTLPPKGLARTGKKPDASLMVAVTDIEPVDLMNYQKS